MPEPDHDHAMAQALAAQMPSRAFADSWQRFRNAVAADASAPPSPGPENILGIPRTAARAESNGASQGPVRTPDGASGPAAADGAVQTSKAERPARSKPIPPTRTREQSAAALDAARQRNAELKALRARLKSGELTLAELLTQAQSDHAAARMLVRTALLAMPGIRTAKTSQLMAAADIDANRRAGILTDRQRERLLAAVAAVYARPGRSS